MSNEMLQGFVNRAKQPGDYRDQHQRALSINNFEKLIYTNQLNQFKRWWLQQKIASDQAWLKSIPDIKKALVAQQEQQQAEIKDCQKQIDSLLSIDPKSSQDLEHNLGRIKGLETRQKNSRQHIKELQADIDELPNRADLTIRQIEIWQGIIDSTPVIDFSENGLEIDLS